MSRGRKPGTKLAAYETSPYAFRLGNSPEQAPYKALIDGWLAEAEAQGEVKSHALRRIVCGLIDHYNGAPLGETVAASPSGFSVESLKAEMMDELRAFVRSLVGDPARLSQLVTVSESGDDISDDVIDNILSDFDR